MKVAIISDVRYSGRSDELNDIYLQRVINRLNRYIDVDAVCLVGDFFASSKEDDISYLQNKMKDILEFLSIPALIMEQSDDPVLKKFCDEISDSELRRNLPIKALAAVIETAPALCESPYKFLVVDLSESGIVGNVETYELKLPENNKLTDCHLHTPAAYCSYDLEIIKTVRLATEFGLESAVVLEHSGQLYYKNPNYWDSEYNEGWPHNRQIDRSVEYFDEFERAHSAAHIPLYKGFELDISENGEFVILPETLSYAQIRLGAVHCIRSLDCPSGMRDEFLFKVKSLLNQGIDILAHPFRIFHMKGKPIADDLYDLVSDLLKEYSVAAELNFHGNEPDPEFFKLCVEKGVKIAFGSDSHQLYETGEFYPHLKMFESLGIIDDIESIIYKPAQPNCSR